MIEIRHLYKTYEGEVEVEALKDINLTIEDGDIFGIIGMSGAGKSTLVRCINMLEKPTSGEVRVNGMELEQLSAKELRAARKKIAMIFQHFDLLMQRNCLMNVCFPMEIAGVKPKEAKKRAMELLEIVGLPDKAYVYPAQLSGGQQQRVAIARALANNPEVLLCDEATSALDPTTTHQILTLIKELNRTMGITVVIITHQMSVVKEACNRVAILDAGEVAEEGLVSAVLSAPKSEAARRMVFPGREDSEVSDPGEEIKLRLIFRSAECASTPLVAKIAADLHVLVNVISASTQKINDEVYGSLLIGIPRTDYELVRAFLMTIPNLTIEEA